MSKVIAILISLFLLTPAFAETIVLKSGETVEGKIIEKTGKYVKIDFQGVPLTYFLDEIASIDGEMVGAKIDIQPVDNIDEAAMLSYRKISEKYNGSNEVILSNGIKFKPDNIFIEDGCIWLMFKGNEKSENKYEDGLVIPLTEVESVNKTPVNQVDANCALANFYLYKQHDLNKAIEFYEKTLALDSSNKIALGNIGACYNYAGRFEDSIKLGIKAIEIYPDDEKIYFNLGAANAALQRNSEAIGYLNRAIVLKKDFAEAYSNLGVLYYNMNNKELARQNFLKAKEIFNKEGRTELIENIDDYLNKLQ